MYTWNIKVPPLPEGLFNPDAIKQIMLTVRYLTFSNSHYRELIWLLHAEFTVRFRIWDVRSFVGVSVLLVCNSRADTNTEE
jgi:hypothetical protein